MISTLGLALAALPVAFGATYNVLVGPGGKFVYEPEFVQASPGDIVNFTFNPKNHTVTQSTFDTPCIAAPGGARTGFIPVAAGTAAADLPSRQFTVPEGTAPIWFYCGQTGHCGQGMVFAINPPADGDPKSFKAFKDLAIAQNGTASSTTTTSTFTTPPPPKWATATATVTFGGSVYTTTYTSYDGTPPPTPAPNPVDHKIIVGADGALAYSPANISASIGDTVTFEFRPKNHTVTQSSFLNPCTGLDGGFKSGFQPVAADAATFPTYQIKINDTAPIWGYCGQVNHCTSGMVFAINAVESGPNNFAAFVEIAKSGASGTPTGSGSGTPSPSPSGSGALATSISYGVTLTLGVFGIVALML